MSRCGQGSLWPMKALTPSYNPMIYKGLGRIRFLGASKRANLQKDFRSFIGSFAYVDSARISARRRVTLMRNNRKT